MKLDNTQWHALSAEEVLTALETRSDGLSPEEAAGRLREYGPNELARKSGDGPWRIFWRQVNNPIGWLLIGAGVLSVALGKFTDSSVVFGAVIINSIIGFIQEYRAGKAIEALAAMVPESASVIRNGQPATVSARDLVPGDVVTLQSGDKVPADLRVFRTRQHWWRWWS